MIDQIIKLVKRGLYHLSPEEVQVKINDKYWSGRTLIVDEFSNTAITIVKRNHSFQICRTLFKDKQYFSLECKRVKQLPRELIKAFE